MDPLYVFEGYTIDEPWVIVLALAHNYERLKQVPSDETNGVGVTEIGDQYARGTRASFALANWIRSQGYNASAYPGPSASALLLIPPAIASGLGELGKHGSLISRALRIGCTSRRCHHRHATGCNHTRPLRCRRILRDLPGLHKSVSSWRHHRAQTDGARRRALVCGLRQVHSLLCRIGIVRNLLCRVPLDAPGRASEAARHNGSTSWSGTVRCITMQTQQDLVIQVVR